MHSAAEAGSLPCVSKLNRSNPSLLGEADEAGDLPIDVAEVTLRAEAYSTGETSHKTNKQTNKQTKSPVRLSTSSTGSKTPVLAPWLDLTLRFGHRKVVLGHKRDKRSVEVTLTVFGRGSFTRFKMFRCRESGAQTACPSTAHAITARSTATS